MGIKPVTCSNTQGSTLVGNSRAANKVSTFLNQLIADGKLAPGSTQGCSQAEIAAIEKSLGNPLPVEYKNFLQLIGKAAGDLFLGSEIYYRDLRSLLELQEYAKRLLRLNQFSALPKQAFVFFMHQGYTFNYFLLNDGDDPPVYQFCEEQESTTFNKPWNSFSEFLKSLIDLHYPDA